MGIGEPLVEPVETTGGFAGSPGSVGAEPEDSLGPARAALVAAEFAETPAERYCQAQLAALRVAAAILAARARAASGGRLRNVWQVVGEVAPEFAEWSGYFAATQAKRQSVAAGETLLVSPREADDLVRDAQAFHDTVARRFAHPSRAARRTG